MGFEPELLAWNIQPGRCGFLQIEKVAPAERCTVSHARCHHSLKEKELIAIA